MTEHTTTPAPAPATRVPALDGLRGVAVLLVALFHLKVPGLRSGFLGVDVFFVLSGFLITTGLVERHDRTGRFDLVRFWAQRMRRLLPAAALVLLAVLAWCWSTAPFYRRPFIGGDLFHTAVYLANWHFIPANTYFSALSAPSPLLHMWSLSLEEQFYLLWPLVLLAVAGRGRLTRLVVGALLVLASVVRMAWFGWHRTYDDHAYMATDTKAFEPLLGAVLALALTLPGLGGWLRRWARPLGWAGLAGAGCLLPLLDVAPWYTKGGAALFCGGVAALVLGLSQPGPWLPQRLLCLPPLVWLGRISYGVYLWHWPLALLLGADTAFRPARAAIAFATTLAVAAASHRWVEQPILTGRLRPWCTDRRMLTGSLAFLLAMVLAAAPLGGTPLSPGVDALLPRPTDQARRVVTVGDSISLRLMPSFDLAARRQGLLVATAAVGGCSPLGVWQHSWRDDTIGDRCPAVRRQQQERVDQVRPGVVLWMSRYEVSDRYADGRLLSPDQDAFWQAQRDDFRQAVDRLTATGAVLVVVLTEPPGIGLHSRCRPGSCQDFLERMMTRDDLRLRWNQLVLQEARRDHRIRAISLDDVLCPTARSMPGASRGAHLCDDTVDGRLLRPDGTHVDNTFRGPQVAAVILERARAAAA